LTFGPRPRRGPPPRKHASPAGQSASAVHPGSRSSQNSRHRSPQPSSGSCPHALVLHVVVQAHFPQRDPSFPQPPAAGSLTQMGGTQTLSKGRSYAAPLPIPQTSPLGQSVSALQPTPRSQFLPHCAPSKPQPSSTECVGQPGFPQTFVSRALPKFGPKPFRQARPGSHSESVWHVPSPPSHGQSPLHAPGAHIPVVSTGSCVMSVA
jgi:hypothetical protein